MGMLGVFSNVQMEELYIADFFISANLLSCLIGVVLMLLGILWLSVLHDKYTIIITTVEGEISTISSRKREYIHTIAAAMKVALRFSNSKVSVG